MTMSGSTIIVEFASADTAEAFDKCFAYAKEHMDRAAAAGCKSIMLVPTVYKTKPGISREQASLNMIAGYKACIEYAGKLGLTLSAETLESIAVPLASATEMRRYFDAFPTLKYSHDTGNLLVMNEDPAEMYEYFKEFGTASQMKAFIQEYGIPDKKAMQASIKEINKIRGVL